MATPAASPSVKKSAPTTFGPDCCEGPTVLMQILAVLLISAVPLIFTLALTNGSLFAGLLVVGVVALPRILWQPGGNEGFAFQFALGLYWNLVNAACFGSVFLLGAACYFAPRTVLPLMAVYVLWMQVTHFELKDGRAWASFAMREWGFQAFRHFIHLQVVLPEAILQKPADEPLFFAVHPHGVASDFRLLMDGMLHKAMPSREILVLAASVLFKLPLVRELCLWSRCIDASRPVAERALRRGHSLMVLPGGELEQIRTTFQKEEVCLTSVGFVKLALQANTPLVPCYVFGCVDLYKTYSFLYGPREWLRKKFRICIPIFSGSIGVLPRRVPVQVVFGEPLTLQCAVPGKPSDEEVADGVNKYVAALKGLFDEYKAQYGYGDRELTIELPSARKKK